MVSQGAREDLAFQLCAHLAQVFSGPRGSREGNGDWGFLSYLKKHKGNDVLTLVNIGKCGGACPVSEKSSTGPRVKGQMRSAAFCTLYSLFFFTRQLMIKRSSVPSAL